MKTAFSTTMRQATQLMREQNVIEATRVIQRALSDEVTPLRRTNSHPKVLDWSSCKPMSLRVLEGSNSPGKM